MSGAKLIGALSDQELSTKLAELLAKWPLIQKSQVQERFTGDLSRHHSDALPHLWRRSEFRPVFVGGHEIEAPNSRTIRTRAS
jgi:hypothetical protein